MEEALRQSRNVSETYSELSQSLLDAMPGGVVHVSATGSIQYANEAACEILGLTYDRLTKRYTNDFKTETFFEDGTLCPVEEYPVSLALRTGKRQPPMTIGVQRPDESMAWAVFRALPLRDRDGKVEGAIVTFLDITESKRQQLALEESDRNLHSLVDNSPFYFTTVDRDGNIQYVNKTDPVTTPEAVLKRSVYEFHPPEKHEAIRRMMKRVFTLGTIENFEGSINVETRKLYLRNTIWPVYANEEIVSANIITIDITEMRRLQELLRFQATHDPLTALLNRDAFKEKVQEALDDTRKGGRPHVLAYVDLDQFKIVNDTCGHKAGDELLCQVAFSIKESFNDQACVARLGGDEFGILLLETTMEVALDKLRRFQEDLRAYRFTWDGRVFQIGSSMGVVQVGPDSEGYARILRDADLACYAAKEGGRDRIHVYHPDDARLRIRTEHMQLVTRVRQAISNGELQLYFQGIARTALDDGLLRGEVLVRLPDASGRVLDAGDFVPALEGFDPIARLDRDVLSRMIEVMYAHREVLDQIDFITVNLSGPSILDTPFQEYVRSELSNFEGLAKKICFEITETAAVANLENARRFMTELVDLGCRFALDDFGAGFSSFSYLRRLPVHLLKLDGALIRGMMEDNLERILVKSIRELCVALGIETVAEHVETDQMLETVRDVGIEFAQGFGLHRPEPLETILRARMDRR